MNTPFSTILPAAVLMLAPIMQNAPGAEEPAPVHPAGNNAATIRYDGYNPTATAYLHEMLSKTATAAICINNSEHALTAPETAKLQALLKGAKSATTRCAPADCFYLNLQDADGNWLMSLPVQKTQQGIVLLYLKLQGTQANDPLQNWWRAVCNRLGL